MKWKFWNGHFNVDEEVETRIAEAAMDKDQLENQPCPKCLETQLESTSVERGKEGWEIRFCCKTCNSSGILNHSGFHVELSDKGLIKK